MTIDEAVQSSGFKNLLDAGSRKFAQKMIGDTETLLFAYNCNYSVVPVTTKLNPGKVLAIKNKQSGVFAVTDKRLFLCTSVLGNSSSREIPINKVQSIDDASNALMGTAQLRIVGLTDMFVLDLNKSQKSHLSEVKSIIADAKNTIGHQAPASTSSIDQLLKLKELLDAGLITKEEFDSQKAKLL